ncbi:MAG TPA: hypothetical protein VGM43_22905 [Bryobacteraceae bacterium]
MKSTPVNAGKWLAADRGAVVTRSAADDLPTPPKMFPLAERITDAELQALFLLRAKLPTN